MIIRIKHKKPIFFILTFLFLIILYRFAYFFPFTNNAFVVANIRPVAANVNGYITEIYVKNESYVKKGQPLFTVFPKPYELAYKKALHQVEEAKERLKVYEISAEKTQFLLNAQKNNYQKVHFEFTHNQSALVEHAVSAIKVNNLKQQAASAQNQLNALEKELDLINAQITAQQKKIAALVDVKDNAKVNYDETTVYAQNDGIVQNMYVSLGTPIEIRKPIFSFVNTEHLFVQANFNETDLRHVKAGDRVTIYPRIYSVFHPYHGVVISRNWAANRQITDNRTQQQIVTNNEDNWILLPQRFPVQIEILDYDPVNYPLSMGASAFVYIHTH